MFLKTAQKKIKTGSKRYLHSFEKNWMGFIMELRFPLKEIMFSVCVKYPQRAVLLAVVQSYEWKTSQGSQNRHKNGCSRLQWPRIAGTSARVSPSKYDIIILAESRRDAQHLVERCLEYSHIDPSARHKVAIQKSLPSVHAGLPICNTSADIQSTKMKKFYKWYNRHH